MPKHPDIEELARREQSVYLSANQFSKLMVPDDQILNSRGRDYRIYKETLRDDQCASTFAQRRLAVVSKEWQVEPASEEPVDVAAADALRENLHALDFDRATDLMLYARWYGHAVAECMWTVRKSRVWLGDIKVRDRARFAYDLEDRLFLQHLNGRFDPMPDRKFWTVSTGADHDDSPYGLGLAHFCYWPVYFKRNGLKFWLVFAEKFGSPTAAGKVNAGVLNNPEMSERCLEALSAIASETAVLIPEGMEIELIEAARSGAATYPDLINAMDAAIAKLIIGQTASTSGTPGRLGNDDLQADVRAELIKADADLICSSFNQQVASWLTEWNFPDAQPPRMWRATEQAEDMDERAERDSKIFKMGFVPDQDYITETYGPGWSQPAPADFMESVAKTKLNRRGHQTDIAVASDQLAAEPESVIGDRVRDLLSMAEETQDFETFERRLREMMREPAPTQTSDAIERATVAARLLGADAAQDDR